MNAGRAVYNPRVAPEPEHTTSSRPYVRVRNVVMVAYALLYGTLSLLRYETYHSRSLDMAFYVRLVWGLAHGRPDNPIVDAPHWLGLHLEPALFVPAALSRLGLPIAELLLVLQAGVAALALWPAHRLARRRLAPLVGEAWALAAACSVLLLPSVSRCIDYDFHPSTLAVTPLLLWLDAVDERNVRRTWVWLALSLSLREDIGLQAAMVAPTFVAWPGAEPGRGPFRVAMAAQALVGTAWFFVYVLAVQPRFLPMAATSSFGAHFERFGGGQGGVGGVLAAALANPLDLAAYLVSGDRLLYPVALLSTVGLVALASPRWLAGLLPIVGINLLSDFAGVRNVSSHYATTTVPFLVAAAIHGAARLGRFAARRSPALLRAPSFVLVVAAAVAFWLRGAAPGAPDFTLDSYVADAYTAKARAMEKELGGRDCVVAEVRLLAHLAERPEPLMDPGSGCTGSGGDGARADPGIIRTAR